MKSVSSVKKIAFTSALFIAILLAVFPLSEYPTIFSYSAGVVLVTLMFWSTGFFPPFMAGLIFFALATIFNLIEPSLLFSGFGSTAVWLIISGFVIGSAISESGLSRRMASLLSPMLTSSYLYLIAGLVLSAVLLGFVMPSSVGRAVVLVPIGMALAEQVGFERGSNGRMGIATALALSCNMPSFAVLPSNIPNMILAGSCERLFNINFGYTEYLLLHFPILGLLKSILIITLVVYFFPAHIDKKWRSKEKENETYDLAMQRKVAVLLCITLLFWVTDTLHGINPAWVGLATAIILLLPKWGVLEPKRFNSAVDFATVIFVAAALGLGTLVNHSGLGTALGQVFSEWLPLQQGESFLNFMSLSLISTLTGLVATVPGVPTVLSPMAADFADATGFSIPAVLMTQVIGFSTVIFPYQVAPLILAMQLSQEPLAKLLKITLPLAIITIVVLMPMDYLWWLWLGWIA
ncbi:SLC13 family permease [Shewanella putrefaciens]|uniref:SLC13 family permease n=1 Tax=Shewanella putrefaciens TaxID=24 RepID=UPI0021BECA4D|nr:SLC13 family permease [Shewanella putrefaciens]UXK06840.1 SLC13 family permease [Shewanella putrefaciens]